MKAKLSIVFDSVTGSAGSVTAKGNNNFTSLLCRPFSANKRSNRKSQQREGWKNWGVMWENMSDLFREAWQDVYDSSFYLDEYLSKAPENGRDLFFQACVVKYWSGRRDYLSVTSLSYNSLTCLPVPECIPETGEILFSSDSVPFEEGQLVKLWISKPALTELRPDPHKMCLLGYFLVNEDSKFDIREALEDRFNMLEDKYYSFNYAAQIFAGKDLTRSALCFEEGRMALLKKPELPHPMPDNVVKPYYAEFSAYTFNLFLKMTDPYEDERYYYEVQSTDVYETINEARAADFVSFGALEPSSRTTYTLTSIWNSTFGKPTGGKSYYIMQITIIDKEGEYDTEIWDCSGKIGETKYFKKFN